MKTKSTKDFLIIARLESLIAGLGMNETMMRAEKYINAGVDGIMIHSKLKEPSEVLEFIPKFEKLCTNLGRRPYLIAVPTTYNTISDDELINSGVDIIIHANHLLRAAYKSMLETASLILNSRRSNESDSDIASVKEIFSAVGYDKIIERDKEKSPNISALIVSAGDHKINNIQRSLNKISDINIKKGLKDEEEVSRTKIDLDASNFLLTKCDIKISFTWDNFKSSSVTIVITFSLLSRVVLEPLKS